MTEHPNAAAAQGWTIHGRRNPADVACWLYGREFVFLTPTGQIIEIPDEETA